MRELESKRWIVAKRLMSACTMRYAGLREAGLGDADWPEILRKAGLEAPELDSDAAHGPR
jgi:hypothetical protein